MGFHVQKKMKRASSSSTQRTEPPRRPNILRTLISAFRSADSQGLKLPQMKHLYCILNYLSLKTAMCFSENGASVNSLDMEYSQEGFTVIYTDLHMISDILFKEFDEKFNCYFCALLGDSVDQSDGQASLHFDLSTDMKELTLLLRCCMVILTLSASDQIVLMEKCRVLLSVLRRIFSLNVNEGNETNSISFEKKSASLYICTLLEVFTDELLTHKSLREYLMVADSISLSSEMLFACHFGPGDIGSVLEVMCYHFILSVPNEQSFDNFLERLFWKHDRRSKIPELSLSAALSLLLHPIVLSAPKMFQANLILLISESINSGVSSEIPKPDLSLMGLYLTAFEKSVALYSMHMPGWRIDDPLSDAKCHFAKPYMRCRSSHPSLDYYIKEDTRDKIHHVVTESDGLFDSGSCNKFFRAKSELLATYIGYMEENQHIFDESCKDKILSIASCILHKASDDEANNTLVEISPQESCLVAAVMKLMSSSLLQAVWCLRYSRSTGGPQASEDSLCKGYDFIMKVVGCFQDFKTALPVQKVIFDMIKGQRVKHKEFKWILVHFSGLLSLSLVRGIDFLVKNCIFMIMALLNLLSLVDNDLAVLVQLFRCESESCLHNVSPARVHEARSNSKANLKVASNFLRIQRRSSCHGNTRDIDKNEFVFGMEEEETERGCKGGRFLKCVMETSSKSIDFEELEDFVECKKGKDYYGWLKVRQRYRTWKEHKKAGLRWKKMKRMWKLLKGNSP